MPVRKFTGRLAIVVACLLTVGLSQSFAQTPLDEPLDEHAAKRLDRMEKAMKEVRAILFQGRETGAPVVVQPADTQASIGALSEKINDINQSFARLNGEIEVLTHDVDQARQEARELRTANDALRDRVAILEKGVKDLTPPPPPPPAAATAGPPDPAMMFAAAKAALDAGDNTTAESGFRAYVDQYGDGPGGPEARFYLGKTLIARRAWPDAATAEIGAIRGWPHTRWAPEAVLDLSRSLVAMGKAADACQTLGELTRRYPKATATVVKAAGAVRAQAQCG